MLDLLIVAYTQFMIMLIELNKVVSQELKCICSKTTTVLLKRTVSKTVGLSLLLFYSIRIK